MLSTLLENQTLIVLILAVLGAFIGLVIGGTEGTPGSGLVRGFVLGVVMAVLMLGAVNLLDRYNPTNVQKKPDTDAVPPEKSKKQ